MQPGRERPNPHAHEVKNVYQYVKTEAIDWNEGRFRVTNRYDFLSLDHVDLFWTLEADGERVASGQVPPVRVPPRSSGEVRIPLPPMTADAEYFLTVSARTNRDAPQVAQGFEIGWDQLGAPRPAAAAPPPRPANAPSLTLVQTTEEVTVRGTSFTVVFDRRAGAMRSLTHRGVELGRSI